LQYQNTGGPQTALNRGKGQVLSRAASGVPALHQRHGRPKSPVILRQPGAIMTKTPAVILSFGGFAPYCLENTIP
jgi:hypothetical protein